MSVRYRSCSWASTSDTWPASSASFDLDDTRQERSKVKLVSPSASEVNSSGGCWFGKKPTSKSCGWTGKRAGHWQREAKGGWAGRGGGGNGTTGP